tara:strand:- start:9115 stop:9420 length:306 start_codon:yes stop_codon:yes gene_type:complete
MPEKLNSDILDEVIYQLGMALRDNQGENPVAKIEVDGIVGIYKNNYISINFADLGHHKIGLHIHFVDLPKKHQEYLRSSLAMWFINVNEGYLVEPEEVIQA